VLGVNLTISNVPETVAPGVSGILYIFAVAAGAGGASAGLNGGGGAAAGFAAIRISPASSISHQGIPTGSPAATDGGDVVLLVDGRTLTCGGGKASGAGGIAVGFDIARNGGASGSPGPNGGTAGATSGTNQGGGGCGGFLDLHEGGANANPIFQMVGNGGAGNSAAGGGNGGTGSGGGSGATTGGIGGGGRVFWIIVQDLAP
jgi:hypothetical protein